MIQQTLTNYIQFEVIHWNWNFIGSSKNWQLSAHTVTKIAYIWRHFRFSVGLNIFFGTFDMYYFSYDTSQKSCRWFVEFVLEFVNRCFSICPPEIPYCSCRKADLPLCMSGPTVCVCFMCITVYSIIQLIFSNEYLWWNVCVNKELLRKKNVSKLSLSHNIISTIAIDFLVVIMH